MKQQTKTKNTRIWEKREEFMDQFVANDAKHVTRMNHKFFFLGLALFHGGKFLRANYKKFGKLFRNLKFSRHE